jgi:hypothetical protein
MNSVIPAGIYVFTLAKIFFIKINKLQTIKNSTTFKLTIKIMNASICSKKSVGFSQLCHNDMRKNMDRYSGGVMELRRRRFPCHRQRQCVKRAWWVVGYRGG